MQRTWLNRNININLLIKQIEEFFKNNAFDIAMNKTEKECKIMAKSSPNYPINGQILVTISGKPEELSIAIDFQRKGSGIIAFPMILATFFGAGSLITQHFKSEETWIELRKDFWQHVNKIVENLSESASTDENEGAQP
jgi:hypothetical protein